jgi:hypothetical protein
MRRFLGGASAFLAVLVACTGETEAPPRQLSATDQFAQDLAAVMCSGIFPCCEQEGFEPPVELCPTTMRNHTVEAILVAAEQRREATLDDTESCLQTFRDALEAADTCGALPHPRSLTQLCPELFGPIPEGDKAPGELCEFTYECSAPSEEGAERQCYQRDFNSSPRCTWFLPTEAGDPCADELGKIHVCGDGLGCAEDEETLEFVCGEPPDFDEPCSISSICAPGLMCVASLALQGEIVCVDIILMDDPCYQEPDACAEGLFCDLAIGRCAPMPINIACNGKPCPAVNLQATCR